MNERKTLALVSVVLIVLTSGMIITHSWWGTDTGGFVEQTEHGDTRVAVPQIGRGVGAPASGSAMLQSSTLGIVGHLAWRCADLAIDGSILFGACGQDLMAFDISNSATPSELGSYHGQNAAIVMAVDGTYAYVVDAMRHLLVIDVTSPTSMALVSNTTLALGVPREAIVVGDTLFLAEAPGPETVPSGLRAIAIQSPNSPAEIDLYALAEVEGRGLSVVGDTLYVATWTAKNTGGLYVFDASQPSTLRIVSSYVPNGSVTGVATADDRAFINVYNRDRGVAEMQIVNTATVQEPFLLGVYQYQTLAAVLVNTGFVAREKTPFLDKLTTSGGKVFSVAAYYGLESSVHDSEPSMRHVLSAIDTTNDSLPAIVGSIELQVEKIDDIVTDGNYIYIAGGTAGIVVVHSR